LYEDILRLDIPVHNVVLCTVRQTSQNVPNNHRGNVGIELLCIILYEIE